MYEISPEGYLNQYHLERDAAEMKSRHKKETGKRDREKLFSLPLLLSIVFHREYRKPF